MTGATIRRSLAICALAARPGCGRRSRRSHRPGRSRARSSTRRTSRSRARRSRSRTIEMSRKFETKTNKKRRVHPDRPAARQVHDHRREGRPERRRTTSTSASTWPRSNFTLEAGRRRAADAMSKEDAAKAEAKVDAIKTAFDEGVALSNAGKNDEAIAKFNEVLADGAEVRRVLHQHRHDLHAEEGLRQGRGGLQEGDRAQAGLGEAYNGLANVYNAQKKFDQAAEASAQAMKLRGAAGAARRGGGGNAVAMFNQGVILWNAGKIPEAKKQFEQAVEARPEHGRSALLARHGDRERGQTAGGGKPQFETYLKLAPTGPNAETAKGIVASIKKYVESLTRAAAMSIAANLADVRARIAAAAAAAGRRPGRHPPRRRLEDVLRRRTSAPPAPPASATSARTRSRKRCRRSTRRPICRSGGISSATCSRTRRGRRPPPSRASTRSTRSICCEASTRRRRKRARRRTCCPGRSRRRGDQVRRAAKRTSPRSSTAALDVPRRAADRADAAAAVERRPGTGAARGSCGCASCATGWSQAASTAPRLRRAVDGHEPRLRGGDRGRGDARPRRHRDFRQTNM